MKERPYPFRLNELFQGGWEDAWTYRVPKGSHPVTNYGFRIESPEAIVLSGEIDAVATAQIADQLCGHQPPIDAQLVDCADVTFFGAAGVTLLLRMAGGRPVQIVASAVVAQLISMCEVGDVLVVLNR